MVAKKFQSMTRLTNIFTRITIHSSHYLFDPIASALPLRVTPNSITWARAFLIPIIVALLVHGFYIYALIVYLIAALSDGIDGSLARVRGLATKHGALLDPLIDKLLHIAIFTVFLPNAPVLILITIALDFGLALIVGIMAIPRRTQNVISNMKSNVAGKWKFFFQASALAFLFLANITNVQYLFIAAQIALASAIFFSSVAIIIYSRDIIRALNS